MSKPFPGERLLIKVIDDLADFLPYLVLVGGWVPYIYARYIWKNVPNLAVTTSDIDFGVGVQGFDGKDTVASRVQKLGYGERQNREKLKKDLYYVYYMLRFCPKKEQLVDDVLSFIKSRKEGKRVKQNLNEYFNNVDSKGPFLVEEENGADAYIGNLRQDIFDRFNGIRQRITE